MAEQTEPRAPELPAEVLEVIFSLREPGFRAGKPPGPLLSAKERLCCQLVCKAWRYALDARRWPLGRLHLDMYMFPEASLGAAEWVLRVRPTVQRLELDLSGYRATLEKEEQPLAWDSPEVQAAHASLLALQPLGALRSLSLSAPFPVLERFLPDLGRLTGLRQLELRAEMTEIEDEDRERWLHWCEAAVLTPALLRHLPPQLQRLELDQFFSVQLKDETAAGEAAAAADVAAADDAAAAGEAAAAHAAAAHVAAPAAAGAAGEAAPGRSALLATLPPGLTHLGISGCATVSLDMPLPGLPGLSISCHRVDLAGERLHLPQLTSLQLSDPCEASVRGSAMPALAQLALDGPALSVTSGLTELQQLTHLHMPIDWGNLPQAAALVASLAPSLRSLDTGAPGCDPEFQEFATRALAAASQLTCLKYNSLACLPHLPAWPHLQELRIIQVRPSDIGAEQQALLAAATGLCRLAFSFSRTASEDRAAAAAVRQREEQRAEELQLALGYTVAIQGFWF